MMRRTFVLLVRAGILFSFAQTNTHALLVSSDTPSTTSAASTTLSTTVNIEDLVTDTSSPTPTGGAGAITLDPVVLFACAALGLAGYGAAF
jgi:hypothetical protein